jgi:hypothetical protein
MNTSHELRFFKKMKGLLGLFWLGLLLVVAGVVGIFSLRPLGAHINMITALACTGFGVIAIASVGRATGRCPQCGKPFCGYFEDEGKGSSNIFASSCRHCGFRATRTK